MNSTSIVVFNRASIVVHLLTITLTFQISFINDQTVQINLSMYFLNVSLGKCIVVVIFSC